MNDDAHAELADDIAAVNRIDALQTMLQVLCEITGMGFVAVARVTETIWTACAVRDDIQFGLKVGQQLDAGKTFCCEVRESGTAHHIDHASVDARYAAYPSPKINGYESYISVPIILSNGDYFGNLCALDRRPIVVSDARIELMFHCFARLIAQQLEVRAAQHLERTALADKHVVGNLRGLFIALLAHDLREPLADAQRAGEELESRSSDRDLRKIAERVKTQVHRMSSLVDDVLDHARGRLSGGIPLRLQTVDDLAVRLDAVVAKTLIAHPGRTVVWNITVARPVHCDSERIQQLASNLLSNALRHGSPAGPVAFVASIEKSDLVLEVWNQGNVIAPGAIKKLFNPFWHQGTDRRKVRLGLHMCFEIVRAHLGRIKVKSSRSDGTTFVARIPVELLNGIEV